MAHNHIIQDSDLHFIIDPVTRTITNSGNKISVMQFDHHSERLTFEMPVMVEGHAMHDTDEIIILYNNTSGGTSKGSRVSYSDFERIVDASISSDGETITFSWSIPREATQYAGTLSFQLKFVCMEPAESEEDTADEIYAWHTNIFSAINVLASYGTIKDTENTYPSAILDIYSRMSTIEDTHLGDIQSVLHELAKLLDRIQSDQVAHEEDVEEINERLEALEYEPIEITNLYIEPDPTTDIVRGATAVGELGMTVNELTFDWLLNKEATTAQITTTSPSGESTQAAVNTSADVTHVISGPWSDFGTHNFKLTVTDSRGTTATKTASLAFYNAIYYGSLADDGSTSSFNNDAVLSLNKELSNSKARTITVTADEGEYIYYCLPMRLGAPEFTVDGFSGGFTCIDNFGVTNESGYEEDYDIWRSDNPGLGTVTIAIK